MLFPQDLPLDAFCGVGGGAIIILFSEGWFSEGPLQGGSYVILQKAPICFARYLQHYFECCIWVFLKDMDGCALKRAFQHNVSRGEAGVF